MYFGYDWRLFSCLDFFVLFCWEVIVSRVWCVLELLVDFILFIAFVILVQVDNMHFVDCIGLAVEFTFGVWFVFGFLFVFIQSWMGTLSCSLPDVCALFSSAAAWRPTFADFYFFFCSSICLLDKRAVCSKRSNRCSVCWRWLNVASYLNFLIFAASRTASQ